MGKRLVTIVLGVGRASTLFRLVKASFLNKGTHPWCERKEGVRSKMREEAKGIEIGGEVSL